jgi:hypothetical protein
LEHPHSRMARCSFIVSAYGTGRVVVCWSLIVPMIRMSRYCCQRALGLNSPLHR